MGKQMMRVCEDVSVVDPSLASPRRGVTSKPSGKSDEMRQEREDLSDVDLKPASSKRNFRQHILEQVKRKLGVGDSTMPRSSLESQEATRATVKESHDSREPEVQVIHVTPSKKRSRPKGPECPGAREPNAQFRQ